MTQSTARRAHKTLDGMVEQIRAELEASSSLQEFEDRLKALDLNDDDFAQAMSEAVLIMQMAGQAEALEQMRDG